MSYQTPVQLVSPNAVAGGNYGRSVAAAGNVLAVGAAFEYDANVTAGRAYIYTLSAGKLQFSLHSTNPVAGGNFGEAVATNGKIVVVGAPQETVSGFSGAGRVYVFLAANGHLLRTLTSPNPQSPGYFGGALSLSGSTLLVGAQNENASGLTQAGRAYAFDASTGSLLASFASGSPQKYGYFGFSVGTDGKKAIVGAFKEDNGSTSQAGNAYLFAIASGARLLSLSSPNAQSAGWFGWSVAIGANQLAVGAIGESPGGFYNSGEVYVLNSTTGTVISSHSSPYPSKYGNYGWEIALHGPVLVVGAPREKVQGLRNAGRVYVQYANGTVILHVLHSPNVQSLFFLGGFGTAVADSGQFVAVGAPSETSAGSSGAGNAYIF